MAQFKYLPHVAFPVQGLDIAVGLCVELFGFQVVSRSHGEVEIALGDLHLHLESAVNQPTTTWVALTTEHWESMQAALVSRGCRVERVMGDEPGLLVTADPGLGFFISSPKQEVEPCSDQARTTTRTRDS